MQHAKIMQYEETETILINSSILDVYKRLQIIAEDIWVIKYPRIM